MKSMRNSSSYGNLNSLAPAEQDDEQGVSSVPLSQVPISSNLKKLVIVMVGLPARGKTAIARKIARYLQWLGYTTRNFNVGNYRRSNIEGHQTAEFFDPDNEDAMEKREKLAKLAVEDLVDWIQETGDVAIFDATNTTEKRRIWLKEALEEHGLRVLFVESICKDQDIIENNIRETKMTSPDYAGIDPAAAVDDFRKRIAFYDNIYETIQDENVSYIKLIDVGRQVICNRIKGFMQSKLVSFVMNIHTERRPIFFTRHGESLSNEEGKLGEDRGLSEKGKSYAKHLAEFMNHSGPSEYMIWTSCLKRTIETVSHFKKSSVQWRILNEIDSGICTGMTYEEVEKEMPQEFIARSKDKLGYRYPQGESYRDLIQRLEPMVFELERVRKPVLVVAHQAVLRVLYAYFVNRPHSEIPYLNIPLHTVIRLTPKAYGCDEEKISLQSPSRSLSKSHQDNQQ